MECYTTLLMMIIFIFLWPCRHFFINPILQLLTQKAPKPTKNMPPGPRPYPIIGNMLKLISPNPHQTLSELSKSYGPLMTLKLGSIITIVISSPEIAKEALTTNDLVFSNREIPDIMRVLDHDKVSLVWLPASSVQWRNLRKICATNIFCTQKLASTSIIRHKKVQELLNFVHLCCNKAEAIDIGDVVFTTVINSLSHTFFSMDFADYNSISVSQNCFKELIEDIMEESGNTNVADLFPILRLLDPQGIRRRGKDYTQRLMRTFNGIIDERLTLRAKNLDSGGACRDVLDSFLNLIQVNDSAGLSRHDFLHLLQDLFVAGTDTTTSTVEWAMAELLRNPEKMDKAKEELLQVLGKDGIPEESDMSKFPYLQAIVKETFRLHPPVPFLHHKSNSEAEICAFRVPKNAQVLVNLWAIGRDSSTWSDPNSFVPERFLESKMDIKGNDFELIPFGAGRRMCPGLPLAHRSVHLILASLLHCFNWKIADGKIAQELDMDEKYGLAIRRCQSLRAVPIKAY